MRHMLARVGLDYHRGWRPPMPTLLQLPGALVIGLGLVLGPAAEGQSLIDEVEQLADLMSRRLGERSARWTCPTARRFVCGPEGCDEAPPVITIAIDFAAGTYARCDSSGCGSDPLVPTPSGIFTIISPTGGTFFKALNDGSAFTEVATLGLTAHTTYGQCTPQ
jgi:hypothetical protein